MSLTVGRTNRLMNISTICTIALTVCNTLRPQRALFSRVLFMVHMTQQQQREFDAAAQRARNVRNDNRAYAIRYGR